MPEPSDLPDPAAEADAPSGPPAEMDDRPPVFGSWRTIYGVVLGVLALLIALFALITEAYR